MTKLHTYLANKVALLFWALIGLFALSSCSIEEEIHFNKDYSGSLKRTFDMRQMISMVESMKSMKSESDSSETSEEEPSLPEMLSQADSLNKQSGFTQKLSEIEGISNANFKADEAGVISFSFDFANIEALNKGYNVLREMNNTNNMANLGNDLNSGNFNIGEPPSEEEAETETPKEDFTYFIRKGRTLIYRQPPRDDMQNNEEETGRTDEEFAQMMKSMGSMMSFTIRMTFDRKVKKIDRSNIDAEEIDKGLMLNFGLSSINDNGKQAELKVKLK